MITPIQGLHHVTALARDARGTNDFFTRILGLRRVKKTVNFDAPDVYHLYYGDAQGTPGTVMTYFPFPRAARGQPGTGEVGVTNFAVPQGATGWWSRHLADHGVAGLALSDSFGVPRLAFRGPDGDGFALIESDGDTRVPWAGGGIDGDMAIRGFHSVGMRLEDGAATDELLRFMGYDRIERHGSITRYAIPGGNDARIIDIETAPGATASRQGAGSVHHIAFAVPDRAAQSQLRQALLDTGYQVTPVIDRDYFWAIYFRTPGGVLFEVATNEPGFTRDEDPAHLGEALKLPARHEHLRAALERDLQPIEG